MVYNKPQGSQALSRRFGLLPKRAMCRLWAARLTGPLLALLLVAAAMGEARQSAAQRPGVVPASLRQGAPRALHRPTGRAEGAAPAPALAPESDCLLPPSAADDGDAGGVELGMEPLFSFGLIADAQVQF